MTDTQKLLARIDSILSTTMPHITGPAAEAYWRPLLEQVRDALAAQDRAAIIEECAKVAREKTYEILKSKAGHNERGDTEHVAIANKIDAAIRALIGAAQ